MNKKDYKALFLINEKHPELFKLLNRNGAANLTVCPECRVDDLVHAEGCELAEKCYRAADKSK